MSLKQDGVYCIYRHLKPCGEVFYIGISDNLRRPYNKSSRSAFWKRTVKKIPNYEVQILTTGLTMEEACEIEIMLIAWYKRRDCCGGTLVNLTDGGEATQGRIMEDWQKVYLSKLKKEGHANGTYTVDMEGVYRGIEERNRRWVENPQLKKDMSIKVAEKIAKNNILKIDRQTKEVLESFSNFIELRDKYPDVGKSVIYSVCNGNKKSYRGFLWRYQDKITLEILEPVIEENKIKKKVLDTTTYIVYESCTFSAKTIDMQPKTLNAKLNNKNPNDTSYRYLKDFLNENPNFDTKLLIYYNQQ